MNYAESKQRDKNTTDETVLRFLSAKNKPWLTIKDIILLTGFSDSTLRRRIRSRSLKSMSTTPGGKLLIKREWLDRFLGE